MRISTDDRRQIVIALQDVWETIAEDILGCEGSSMSQGSVMEIAVDRMGMDFPVEQSVFIDLDQEEKESIKKEAFPNGIYAY